MSRKHIHKYHKVSVNGTFVWACGLPDCNHHMPKHYEEMVIGKASICWSCGNTMILDRENMRADRPECNDCKMPLEVREMLK